MALIPFVEAGSPVSASVENQKTLALRRLLNNGAGAGRNIIHQSRDHSLVLIQNNTGQTLDRFDTVGLGELVITPSGNLSEFLAVQPVFSGVMPTARHANRFAVVQQPLAPGRIAPAVAVGVTQAAIDVQSLSDCCATPAAGRTELVSTVDGVPVLWPPEFTTTGIQWCVLALTPVCQCDAASASGSLSGSVNDPSGSGIPSGSGGGGSGLPSGSGGGGSGGGGSGVPSGSGGDCVDCVGICLPSTLTLSLDSVTRFGNPHDCQTQATLTYGASPLAPTSFFVEDVTFGNDGGTDCSFLDGLYRLRAWLEVSSYQDGGETVCGLKILVARYHKNNPADVVSSSPAAFVTNFSTSPVSASGSVSFDNIVFNYQVDE